MIKLCNHVPTPSWDQIAAQLPGRTADACARRHRRISNREIVPASVSPDSPHLPSATLLSMQALMAPVSSPTSSKPLVPARLVNVGRRYGMGAAEGERDRKRKRSGSISGGIVAKSEWTKEENDLLLRLIERDEPKSWGEVKDALPGRSEGACRGRYGRILKEREADANSKGDQHHRYSAYVENSRFPC